MSWLRFDSLGHLAVLFALGTPSLALLTWFLARRIVRRLRSPIRGLADGGRTLLASFPADPASVSATDLELRRLEQELNAALSRLEEAIRRKPDSWYAGSSRRSSPRQEMPT